MGQKSIKRKERDRNPWSPKCLGRCTEQEGGKLLCCGDLGPQAEREMRIKQDVQKSAGGADKENKIFLGLKLDFTQKIH